ncbi:MAG: MaoC family dehydratase [Pseudomonadota bacterium]
MSKTYAGRFFEDFRLGETLVHATPRTVTTADATLYLALTGQRYAHFCADEVARRHGLERSPIDDLLVFHLVFGKSVPDVSLNAVANLGYAEGRFLGAVQPGETLYARSEVIGLKANSNGTTGTVWVRTRGFAGERPVLEFVRWVMVRKRDAASPDPAPVVPELRPAVDVSDLVVPAGLVARPDPDRLAGAAFGFDDYAVGERIDHVDGMTVDEAEHRLATRLYQNTAKVHFNDHAERQGRFGRCIVYGGHVISLARGLAFNGLADILHVVAINAGTHANPCFAGDTVFAWSEVLAKAPLPGRDDLGALRLRLVATKNHPCSDFPLHGPSGRYHEDVLLDFDYWALMPRGG